MNRQLKLLTFILTSAEISISLFQFMLNAPIIGVVRRKILLELCLHSFTQYTHIICK
jgi:hypothetical protein